MKYAVLAAINDYPGSKNDLRGCLNDSMGLRDRLTKKFGYTNITQLLDSKATVVGFQNAVTTAISKLKSGDTLGIAYSGHGTYLPDDNGDESDGRDEAIYLYDGALRDDFFRKAFKNIPAGANLWILTDSCFSGTVTRLGPVNGDPNAPENYIKSRFKAPTGDDKLIGMKVKSRIFDSVREEDMREILITGCSSTQTSADAYLGGKYYGALSFHVFKVIDANPPGITYNQFYKQLRKYLPSIMYAQIPQLEGSVANKNRLLFT